jgi:hypothetical protein
MSFAQLLRTYESSYLISSISMFLQFQKYNFDTPLNTWGFIMALFNFLVMWSLFITSFYYINKKPLNE